MDSRAFAWARVELHELTIAAPSVVMCTGIVDVPNFNRSFESNRPIVVHDNRCAFRAFIGYSRCGPDLEFVTFEPTIVPSLTVEKLKLRNFNTLRTFGRLVPLRPLG